MNTCKKAAINDAITAIPEALRECPQWVCWQLKRRPDGKLAKVPCQPDGTCASVTDPRTWSDFRTCIQNTGWGVGFVLTPEAGFVAIDLDHVRSRATGKIEAWAEEIVQTFDTYTEVSPSGTGLHLWLRGTLPPGGRRRAGIEVYSERRYMTVTGEHLPTTPCILIDRQDVLTSWHREVFGAVPGGEQSTALSGVETPPAREDAELVEMLGKPSHKWWVGFDELYRQGDLMRWGEDFSRGLFCLALMLARETRDAMQIERIVKASKVYRVAEAARKKWDAKRGQATWGSQLIESALQRAAVGA
jgi:putative DNA primase/helicase